MSLHLQLQLHYRVLAPPIILHISTHPYISILSILFFPILFRSSPLLDIKCVHRTCICQTLPPIPLPTTFPPSRPSTLPNPNSHQNTNDTRLFFTLNPNATCLSLPGLNGLSLSLIENLSFSFNPSPFRPPKSLLEIPCLFRYVFPFLFYQLSLTNCFSLPFYPYSTSSATICQATSALHRIYELLHINSIES